MMKSAIYSFDRARGEKSRDATRVLAVMSLAGYFSLLFRAVQRRDTLNTYVAARVT